MYCQNCGKPNSDDSIFCEFCGSRLEKDTSPSPVGEQPIIPTGNGNPVPSPAPAMQQPPQQPIQQPQPKKPISKLTIVLAIEIVALLAIVYGAFSVGKKGTGAEQTAMNYFINIANSDWEKAYQKLDVDASTFINSQMFAEANQENALGMINTYEIDAAPGSQLDLLQASSLGQSITIGYRVKGETENSYFTVNLNKQPDKKYFLFDHWKVGTSNLICKDYSIYVPAGASVTVDGISLDQTYLAPGIAETYEMAQDVYVIPQIFYGTHTITVSMEDREDTTSTVRLSYEYGDNQSFYVEPAPYQADVLSQLTQLAGADMQQIYNAAMAGKAFKTLEGLFTTDETYLNDIRSSYEYLLSSLNEGSSVPTKVTFSNITGVTYPYDTAVDVSFEYEVEYTYEDWWTNERKTDRSQNTATWRFYFIKENGNWVLANLGCDSVYY